MARQRSWVEWFKEGDSNTYFFHACASARRHANKINALAREDGSRWTDMAEIQNSVGEFYTTLFRFEPCDSKDEVLNLCRARSPMT
jgi:hypothetical protein